MHILYLCFLLIITMLLLEYSLSKNELKYFKSAKFYLFLLEVVAASSAGILKVSGNFIFVIINMFN